MTVLSYADHGNIICPISGQGADKRGALRGLGTRGGGVGVVRVLFKLQPVHEVGEGCLCWQLVCRADVKGRVLQIQHLRLFLVIIKVDHGLPILLPGPKGKKTLPVCGEDMHGPYRTRWTDRHTTVWHQCLCHTVVFLSVLCMCRTNRTHDCNTVRQRHPEKTALQPCTAAWPTCSPGRRQ
jgi:hypothetical protein